MDPIYIWEVFNYDTEEEYQYYTRMNDASLVHHQVRDDEGEDASYDITDVTIITEDTLIEWYGNNELILD